MANSVRYNFDDFTVANYKRLIQIAKKNYSFVTFNDFRKDGKNIFWRHDIDFSPQRARGLSYVEKQEGVTATYFLHIHSLFYNLLEKECHDCICEIINFGHEIGLHFDANYYSIANERLLTEKLLMEKSILEKFFKKKISAFSFHTPSAFALECKKLRYGGMINVYASYFQKSVGYCSDSNGYWRYKRLEDVLKKANDKKLQILTHPGWWQETVMSPYSRIERCVEGRKRKTLLLYRDILKTFGRKNIY